MKRLLIIFVFIFTIATIFFVSKGLQFYKSIYKPSSVKIEENKTAYNFLLLGYGGGKHEGTYLTDSMMLIHIDLKNKKTFLISLPRDLWVKIPTKSGDDFHMKINALYQFDADPDPSIRSNYPDINWVIVKKLGFSNLISLGIYQVTGLKVDNYTAVDFTSFKKAINAIGGVDINVKRAFEDPQYPIDGKESELCGKDDIFKQAEPFINPPYDISARAKLFAEKPEIEQFVKNATDSPELAFPCRYEKVVFKAGMTHIDGETALKYVRSRHGIQDGSDFDRSARQQQFIMAVKEKIISVDFITKILPLMDTLKTDIKTDVSPTLIKKLVGEAPNAQKYSLSSLVLSDQNYLTDTVSTGGQYVLISKDETDNWQIVKQGINNFIAEITPTPISSPTKPPNP